MKPTKRIRNFLKAPAGSRCTLPASAAVRTWQAAALHAGAKQIGDRGRELARYSLSGIDVDEKAAAEAKADELSAKYPSVSRTEVLSHIRQTAGPARQLRARDGNVETVTKAQTVLSTLGNGEKAGEDLEKLTLALESQGLARTQINSGTILDAFVKAKEPVSRPEGEDFRQ